ncbi:MAG: hypothetical protein AMXMBFR64_35910 [Myxococcales bacterium]
MKVLVSAFSLAHLLACASPEAPAAPPAPAEAVPIAAPNRLPELVLSPTATLVKRAEVAALVDALAVEKKIESSHVGAAGAPSAIYAKWEAVEKAASSEELQALLRHERPVVRAYAARHLVRGATPLAAQSLAPLLSDLADVGSTDGCMIGETTVAAILVEDLCYNAKDKEAARALLREAVDGGPEDVARQAERCLPKR